MKVRNKLADVLILTRSRWWQTAPRAALRSHREATGHMLRVGRAAAVVKAGQEVAPKVSGRHYNYNPRTHGSSACYPISRKDLGLVRIASLMTVTQEKSLLCSQQLCLTKQRRCCKNHPEYLENKREEKSQSLHLSKCHTGGFAQHIILKWTQSFWKF